MSKPALAALSLCLASGCASLPDVTVTYFAPKSRTTLTVTQSMDCNKEHTAVFVVSSVSATTTFVADRTRPYSVSYKAFDKTFADVDMAISLTEDGRLKSINANSTGQGEAILKSAAAFALEVIAFTARGILEGGRPRIRLKECDIIAAWGNDKGVTLVYGGALDNGATRGDGQLTVEPGSSDLHGLLKKQLPAYIVRTAQASPTAPVTSPGPAREDDSIWLQFPNAGRAKVEVLSSTESATNSIWTSSVPVTVQGDHRLPIPKPALFGKQTFSLVLSDSGGVSSVGYGKGAGLAGALNAGSALLATHETAAEQAAQLRAQADLIAQTQRLARCKAKPDTCT